MMVVVMMLSRTHSSLRLHTILKQWGGVAFPDIERGSKGNKGLSSLFSSGQICHHVTPTPHLTHSTDALGGKESRTEKA